MNQKIKVLSWIASMGLVVTSAAAQSCDEKRPRVERVAYEVGPRAAEARVVEIRHESAELRVEYSTTVVQQTTVYNVVAVTQPARRPREPHVRYLYVRD